MLSYIFKDALGNKDQCYIFERVLPCSEIIVEQVCHT